MMYSSSQETTFIISPLLPPRSATFHRIPPRCATEQPRQQPFASSSSISPRDKLYHLVTSANSRTETNPDLNPLITALESLSQQDTASDSNLMGTWRNAHTTTPLTSSIIQRAVVSSSFIPHVEQIIYPDLANRPSKILNRVDLRAPLGCVLNVRAAVENIDSSRLSIRFDKAWFAFDTLPKWLGAATLPSVFNLPYPVPFRLLGDKACGWLDITYLDFDMRISRGSRGSCFVLVKEHQNILPLREEDLT